jgi:hypothetical protein
LGRLIRIEDVSHIQIAGAGGIGEPEDNEIQYPDEEQGQKYEFLFSNHLFIRTKIQPDSTTSKG